MMRLSLLSACVLATLFATGLHAQAAAPQCPGGEADDSGISMNVTLGAHPTRVAITLDSLLAKDGYGVLRSPSGEGMWQIEPRFTYLDSVKGEAWVRDPHPGVQLMVGAEAQGDSTHVEIAAMMLCKPAFTGAEAEAVETMLEMGSALTLASELTGSLHTLQAAGVDLRAPVSRPGVALHTPEAVGEFRLANREDYEDPRLGTSLRYARPDGFYLDVYVYPGVPPDGTCPATCAQRRVDEEAEAFTVGFPELIQRGYYSRMDVRSSEALPPSGGDAFLGARHLRMEVVRAQGPRTPLESDFILYAFPGYMVKVRATYPPSTTATDTVREFVAELLPLLTRP